MQIMESLQPILINHNSQCLQRLQDLHLYQHVPENKNEIEVVKHANIVLLYDNTTNCIIIRSNNICEV